MKKISALMAAVLIVVLSVPSVPSLADASLIPGYYTQESVDGFFDGEFNNSLDRDTVAKSIYYSNNNDVDMSILQSFSSLDLSEFNDFCFFVLFNNGVYFFCLYEKYQIDQNYASLVCKDGYFYLVSPKGSVNWNKSLYSWSYYPSTGLSSMQQNSMNSNSVDSVYYFLLNYPPISFDSFSLVYAYNLDGVYSFDEFLSLNPSATFDNNHVTDFAHEIYSGSSSYTNYWNSSLPYYNGSQIIVPEGGGSVSESNENHLVLQNFNIQFCKPFDLNDLYSRAGGGYAAFTYDFDSWVNSHSSDYELNIITQIDVDGQTFTYPNVRNLDVSGVLVLPFSGLAPSYQWSNENLLFVQYPNKLFGNYYLGYIYSLTYQKYASNAERFLGSGRTNRLFFKGHNVNSDFPDLVGSQVEELFSSVTHSNFKISFTVTMVDIVSGERSGSYVKTFDLLNGVYNVTNNTIQDNQNPFDNTEEPYLPVEGSGGGYLPSTNNNLVTNNINIPSDYTVTYRDGVNEFINWYNQDPEVSGIQDTVWGSFGVFRDNPAIDLYEEYFGFLPAPFKAVIFGCGTIGIVGGAACVLRKRLMK